MIFTSEERKQTYYECDFFCIKRNEDVLEEEVQGNGTKRTTVDRMGESSSCLIYIVRARLSLLHFLILKNTHQDITKKKGRHIFLDIWQCQLQSTPFIFCNLLKDTHQRYEEQSTFITQRIATMKIP